MARTKNTTRKAPNRPQRATRPFVCNVCSREFGQSTNYYRYLGRCTESLKTGNRTCSSAESSQSTAFETPSGDSSVRFGQKDCRRTWQDEYAVGRTTWDRIQLDEWGASSEGQRYPWHASHGTAAEYEDSTKSSTEPNYRIHRSLSQSAGRRLSRGRRTWFGRICLTFWRFALLSEFRH